MARLTAAVEKIIPTSSGAVWTSARRKAERPEVSESVTNGRANDSRVAAAQMPAFVEMSFFCSFFVMTDGFLFRENLIWNHSPTRVTAGSEPYTSALQ